MRTRCKTVFSKLASLFLRLVPCKNREWQKSSVQSLTFWLLATFLIYKLVSRLGHGVIVNLSVSLLLDWVVYGINRLWIWRRRQTDFRRSGGRNIAVWAFTAGLNALMAWLVISRVGVVQGRALLGFYGIAMNPVMFHVRDKVVFAEYKDFREVAAARCRQEMNKALTASRLVLMKTGGL